MLKLDKIAHVRLLDLEIVFPHKKYNKEVSTPQIHCSNKALILCLCAKFSSKENVATLNSSGMGSEHFDV